MSADELLIAALVAKMGGEVYLSDSDLRLASELELQRSEGDTFRFAIGLRVRSAATVEGSLVGEVLEIEEHRE